MALSVHRLAAAALAGALFVAASACRQPSNEPAPQVSAEEVFQKSDPAKVGTTGRPQLVEFYHPT
jgi:hypothetical protein